MATKVITMESFVIFSIPNLTTDFADALFDMLSILFNYIDNVLPNTNFYPIQTNILHNTTKYIIMVP